MTDTTATAAEVAAAARWSAWQARGAAQDRRSMARMRVLLCVLGAALALAFVLQLV